jgi:aryl-alcohol dehydrogenase-like predicted oxidoreductase
MKIGLGTVQLGLDYGISNAAGKTSASEAALIISEASVSGVRVLDTAPAYGDSEVVVGSSLREDHRFAIVTKTLPIGDRFTEADLPLVRATFRESMGRLRQTRIHGLLVHRVEDLLGPDGDSLYRWLEELKAEGAVKRIGASVYTCEQVDALMDRFDLDLVQLPFNVLDQRMRSRGTLDRLKSAGVEVHARSAFLQGLLLMEPDSLSPYFAPIRSVLDSYRSFLRERALTPLQAALGFAIGSEEIDSVVCGVNDAAQLRQIVASAQPLDPDAFARFAIEDARFLDPSRWPAPQPSPKGGP